MPDKPTAPPGGPPAKRRRAKAKRWSRALFTLVGLVVLTHALLSSPGVRRWLTSQAEDALSEALGEDVHIGDVRVQPLTASVQLDGLVVQSRRSGRLLVGLDGARARLGLGWRGPRLRLLELDGPVLDLAIQDGALLDFPGLAGGEGESALPKRLPWDELIVRKADLRLSVYAGEEPTPRFSLRVDNLDIRPDLERPKVDLAIEALTLSWGEHVQVAEDLRLFGATIGPDRVHLPDLRLSLPLLRLTGEVSALLDGPLRGHLSLALADEALSELLGPTLDLRGELLADLQLAGTTAEPAIELAAAGRPTLLVWDEAHEEANVFDFGEVTLEGLAGVQGLAIDPLVLRWGGGRLEVDADLGWDGAVRALHARADDLGFAQVMLQVGQATAPWVDFRGDVELALTGTLSPLSLSGPVELAAADLLVAAGPVGVAAPVLVMPAVRLLGDLDVGAEGVQISGRQLAGGRTRGRVDAWLGYAAAPGRPPLDVRFDLFNADLADFAPLGGAALEGRGRVQGQVAGPYASPKLRASGQLAGFSCVGVPWAGELSVDLRSDNLVDLDFKDFVAHRGETTVRGDLRLSFGEQLGLETQAIVQGGRLSDIMGMWIDLPGVEAGLSGTLALAGPIDALEGEGRFSLPNAELWGERFDRGDAVGRMRAGRFTLDHLRLTREEGRESLLARGSVGAGWAMSMDVVSDGLRLERLDALAGVAAPPSGWVGLSATVGGTLMAPEPQGRLTAHELRVKGEFLSDARLDFSSEGAGLRFVGGMLDGTFVTRGAWQAFGDQSYAAQLSLHDAPLDALYPLEADGEAVRIYATGDGFVEGSLSDDRPLRLEVRAEQTLMRWGRHELVNPEPWLLRIDGNAARTEGLRMEGGQTRLSLALHRGRDGLALITGGGELDLDLLQVLTGDALEGEGVGRVRVALNGPLDALDGRVELATEGANLRAAAFPHSFERVDARIQGSPGGYELLLAEGELGGGRFEASGRVRAEAWLPTAYDIDLRVTDARVRYLDDLPAMVGDATLSLDGPPGALLLSGDILIAEMIFSDRLDWEQWTVDFRERRLAGVVESADVEEGLLDLDLRVRSDGGVRVRNNLADGLASTELRVIGDSARPGMVGEVRMLPGGRFFYEDRDFDITRAELHYVDPWSFDPELDFVLETDIRSSERSYHVVLPVTGPFSDWRADPRADPALPQGDINALILFGVTREEIEQLGGAGSAIAMEGLDLLLTGEGQRVLERWGGGVLQYAKIDLLTGVSARGPVVSSDWRVLVEKDIPEPWELTFIGEFNPFRLDDQYLAVERQLTGNVYLNVFWSSYQRERNLSIGGAYGADFRVRWEVD